MSAPLQSLRVGVVGVGAMGRHHVRILSSLPGAELVGIHDPRIEAAEAVAAEHGARVFTSLDELAGGIDAAVLAAPTVTHAETGCALLERGLHLLVEKPIASSLAEADRLIAAADGEPGRRRVLAVGHVEFYNPAVQSLLGLGVPPRFVEIQRLGVFSPRSLDVDVVLDLMIHDLQILHGLDPSPVHEVRATGIAVLSPRIDIANARVELASGCVANLTASRVSAERVRKLRAFLPSRYYSLDYQAQEIKGYRLEEGEGARRIAPDDLPVEKGEPLRRELEAFVAACRGESAPLVTGGAGRRALETALAVVEAIG
ncbi:MAG TPA: Gfo/Idh/MocA family oxidoreductase [Thermoanaerobaculia bacterium]|nr:Gfo/Idh/MocA family oxidoreductase [Thermoanaerobaculia bacterium]